ncbi:LOW QUALITY PROTEIN: nutritionally-regulated adipose and cardiac enriched protein homolog [Malurus melanocephalus]|uniref:LOW QUALITY PROTEIN: nutritionally-regulated adipose and cardiac enriched protein homolog n=1 Tax=Malurus melanocephalus TaxID=175006 RepID=UPI0025490EB7|nr:LOW QUALITY PROTEIN: nutritionally-regulated adipose and cardiac enriched protein homolog [Malurus melanocephalus]
MCYFWLLSASRVASPFPRQPWYEMQKLFFPLLCAPLPLPPRGAGRPRCGGGSGHSFSLVLLLFLGKRLSIQSFTWEAPCWHPEYMSQICPASLSGHSAEEPPTDDCSYPPSILRKRPPVDQAVGEKRKAERRVRFREPEEVIEHVISCCDYVVDDRSSSGLPVLLWLSFCAVLILAVSLYYTSMKQDVKVLEEFQSRLVIVFLHIRHVAQRCWTWFMRQ